MRGISRRRTPTRTGSDDVKNPHKWEDPGSSAETGTNTNNQDTTCTAEHSVSSRQVSWWSVHEHAQPHLDAVGSWPTVGTPQWCLLDDDHPVKIAAIFDAARHWALHLELNQESRCEASRDVSAAADWSRVATNLVQYNSFHAARPWLKRVAS